MEPFFFLTGNPIPCLRPKWLVLCTLLVHSGLQQLLLECMCSRKTKHRQAKPFCLDVHRQTSVPEPCRAVALFMHPGANNSLFVEAK